MIKVIMNNLELIELYVYEYCGGYGGGIFINIKREAIEDFKFKAKIRIVKKDWEKLSDKKDCYVKYYLE